jgi:ATP-dependent Clp protease ATP-binding subunit ClpA
MEFEETFTENARRALAFAQEEARRFNHNYIGTEHILLGVTRVTRGRAARVLLQLGVDTERVRGAIEFIIGRGETMHTGEIGLTPRAKTVIELAVDEARRMGNQHIGTEHLLLGLLREGEGIAAGVLESLGVHLERLRDIVLARTREARGPVERLRQAIDASQNVALTLNQTEEDIVDTMVDAGAAQTRDEAVRWLFRAGIDANTALLDSLRETVAEIRRLQDDARTRLEGDESSEP